MKYFSVIILLLALCTTWKLTAEDNSGRTQDTHLLEEKVEETITQYIKNKKPEVEDVVFLQNYTEILKEGHEVAIHFKYQFTENLKTDKSSAQTFQGHVLLTSEDGQNWKWEDEQIGSALIEFLQGITINPTKTPAQQETPPAEQHN